ncbi:sre G protein-coupled chemoreceptor domain-containing protein [Ditylenchus destructor]|uniref:Sre G protein-coupled chemoreceptor domain-containing protein n=1 Tax=Ditylenchus destructor TaxID=166010 RepID=A0AAD4NBC8_9BILA|nr:sre G protein-coupled chemoreceptor domain-containing protein [Ditylenchus destructor]
MSCPDKLLITLYCVEFTIDVLCFANALVLAIVLLQCKTLHVNLRSVCLSMCFCVIMCALLRFLLIAHFLACNNLYTPDLKKWLFFVLGTFNVSSHLVEISIVIERTTSMLKISIYESWLCGTFAIFLIIFPYAITTPASLAVLLWDLVPIMTANLMLYAVLVLAWLVFFIVFYWSKMREKWRTTDKTLSERYQYYENLQTNQTMKFLCLFCFFHMGSALALQIVRQVVMDNTTPEATSYRYSMFECIMHIVYGICFVVFPFVLIFTITAIRKRFSLFPKAISDVEPEVRDMIIYSISGKKLPHRLSANGHFDFLQKSWDDHFSKKEGES